MTRVTLALSLCPALALSALGISSAEARPAPAARTIAAVAVAAAQPAVRSDGPTVPPGRYSRDARKKRVAQIMTVSFSQWKKIKARKTHTGIDGTFDFGDDGCSAEWGVFSAPNRTKFNSACERHDFGYRNLGHGFYGPYKSALSSFPETKKRIDKILYQDLSEICNGDGGCNNTARGYYLAVSNLGKAYTAFYKRECQPGYICFFDDTDYGDRRVALRGQVSDFDDISFGDKTSSVANFTTKTWRIYDDNGFSDRSVCLAPRGRSANLKSSNDFNDKVSSARPRSSC